MPVRGVDANAEAPQREQLKPEKVELTDAVSLAVNPGARNQCDVVAEPANQAFSLQLGFTNKHLPLDPQFNLLGPDIVTFNCLISGNACTAGMSAQH